MLFCITADYSPQAISAMRENPTTNRREAVDKLLEAAGGKVVAMYGRIANGPGALVIFDVPEPPAAAAICGIVASSGSVQNVKLERLLAQDEIVGIRQRAAKLHGAYRPAGQ